MTQLSQVSLVQGFRGEKWEKQSDTGFVSLFNTMFYELKNNDIIKWNKKYPENTIRQHNIGELGNTT